MPVDMSKVIDVHVHCSPDVRPRKMSGIELAEATRNARLRGFVLKNHQIPTVAQAEIIRDLVPDVEVFGGITLNFEVGGFNPYAVETALAMGAKIVWMPTLCAEHERIYRKRPGTGIQLLDENNKLPDAVRDILKLVAEKGAVLGTGHFSFEEIRTLVEVAQDAGVEKILINHPGIIFQRFSIDQQRLLAAPGVFFERCYARLNCMQPWHELVEDIQAMGIHSSVIGTDLGQIDQPDPVTGMKTMIGALQKLGLSSEELELMACSNPARLLELDEEK